MKRKRKIREMLIAFLMLSLLIVFPLVSCISLYDFSDQIILSKIDTEKAAAHIEYLSSTIGERLEGTKEEKLAAEYIEEQFKLYGYEVSIQEYNAPYGDSKLFLNSLANLEIPSLALQGSPYTDENGITGKVIHCGLGINPSDFPPGVYGSIALIERGLVTFSEKVQNAYNAGAIGVIIYNNIPGIIRGALVTPSVIPVTFISQAEGQYLSTQQNVTATMVIRPAKYRNIIAARKPLFNSNTCDIVHVTANYDSLITSPGANYNASGVGAMLEIARVLRELPTKSEVRFVASGANALGTDGALHYKESLSPDELARSKADFDLNRVASGLASSTVFRAFTFDGNTNIVAISVISAATRLGTETPLLSSGTSSITDVFQNAGISSASFSWTPDMLDGTFFDTFPENINNDRLKTTIQVVAAAVYDLIK